jgi:hypothetical protein
MLPSALSAIASLAIATGVAGPSGRAVHEHLAIDDRREARLRVGRRVAGQAADRPSACDIDDDDAADPLVAAVGDVGDALGP